MLQAYKACAIIAMVAITISLCVMVGLEIYEYFVEKMDHIKNRNKDEK